MRKINKFTCERRVIDGNTKWHGQFDENTLWQGAR